jgi:lipoprotein-anchoring transpeptidase ErfK/SrfK
MTKTLRHIAIPFATLAALTAVVGAGADTTRVHGPELSVRWQAPTPRDGTAYAVKAGEPLTFELSTAPGSVIRSRRLPAGVVVAASSAQVTVQWTPSATQVGEHVLAFGAQKGSRFARLRSFLVYVLPATPAGPHDEFPLGGINGRSRAAQVYADVYARSRPSARGRKLIRIRQYTPEGTLNVVQTLSGVVNQNGENWVRIRLPMLPNGRTGWVPRRTIGPYNDIWTHLVIDRKLFTATLYRKGRAIFTTRVGVGKPYWPTPAGEFYVRERITGFSDPIYGPIAFGTNARSNVLTDWAGGGFVGIHGTNQPEILPGRVSHGCVRMPNAAVLRLARLMPLGTPVTIF